MELTGQFIQIALDAGRTSYSMPSTTMVRSGCATPKTWRLPGSPPQPEGPDG
jgi:hypothetical protein